MLSNLKVNQFKFYYVLVILLLCIVLIVSSSSHQYSNNHNINTNDQEIPAANYNVTQLIESFRYPCLQYYAQTKDGFILSIQRIPGSKISPSKKGKPVVFLQHGLLDSADTWVNNLPSQSLAFILADAGYDVWLGNSRGNVYSRRNIHFDPHQSEFWDWNWDQMGELDLPAAFDLVRRVTDQRRLAYVGHSQGTTQAFAAFSSSSSSIANQVSVFIALAPVARVGHISVPLLPVLAKYHVGNLFKLFGNGQFLPSTDLIEYLLPEFCSKFSHLCKNTYCVVAGCDLNNVNSTRLPVYFSHVPAGTSTQDILHWTQGIRDDMFQHYDYGSRSKNKKHYHQPTPPRYNLTRLDVPVALYSGDQDKLADPSDVSWLTDHVPSHRLVRNSIIPEYGHGDFVWGVDAAELVYNDAIKIIKKYHA